MTEHSVGYRIEPFDSMALLTTRSSNLTEILARNTNVHVRSFGVFGLSGANLRGSGNSHTMILWNGINIQSPTAGELDISLLPSAFIDNAAVQYGGTASLYGAGAIGGAIHLMNEPEFNKGPGIRLMQNYGSFGRHFQSYRLAWSSNRLSTSVNYFRNNSTNDFEYQNTALSGNPRERRANNEVDQHGILVENYWKWSEKDQVSVRFWYQDNEVNVPSPITVSTPGTDTQNDDFNRTLVTWDHTGASYSSTFKSALINHTTAFTSFPATTYHTSVNEYDLNKSLGGNLVLHAGVNNTYEWIDSRNHGTTDPTRNRTAVFASAKKAIGKRTLFNLRFREELVAGALTPFVPSFGIEHFMGKHVQLKSSISRNYLIPTFNQLYWSGAGGFGNPDLNPESSWSEEVGMNLKYDLGKVWQLNSETTLYSNQVDDWIIWIPVTSAEWSPNNIKRVWSRGLEQSMDVSYKQNELTLRFQLRYTFTKATNEEVAEGGNLSEVGKQIIYTPMHSGKLITSLVFKNMH